MFGTKSASCTYRMHELNNRTWTSKCIHSHFSLGTIPSSNIPLICQSHLCLLSLSQKSLQLLLFRFWLANAIIFCFSACGHSLS